MNTPPVDDDKPQPITYTAAAARLDRSPSTLRDWVTRYAARRIGTVGRKTYLDYRDLAFIDGCMHRGEPVPPTPEERDQLRAARRTTALAA
ncbi:helix-turn-helix domain-containing protein [Microbispora sp. GKU 823]|uniref:helix-turn-helix domain-containing protein n=1 Tax=Microbispora sp. GKU 823 TaxID=1652100 RepID=UPI0009A41006|nr:helix-turn-helix domain-containing protein [Microbispora sp. GKU 823]